MRRMTISGWPSQQSPEVQLIRRLTIAIASRYLPPTVEVVGEKAVGGDLEAAKILFNYLGLRPQKEVNDRGHLPKAGGN